MNVNNKIVLKQVPASDYKRLWEISEKEDDYSWVHFNAPYFNEYKAVSYDQFLIDNKKSLESDHRLGIYYNDILVGQVSHYWENRDTRWLEMGIIIYDDNYWGRSIGTISIKQYTTMLFNQYPEIQRVGYTTWSGNPGMMKIGEHLGFTLEKQIRKVRYYNGVYYDSVGYGVLRDEWMNT